MAKKVGEITQCTRCGKVLDEYEQKYGHMCVEKYRYGGIVPEVTDPVDHPSHYTAGNIEVIDFIEDQDLPYHLGNAIKYISRCKHKGAEKQDIEKAVWYLNRYLTLIK